MTRQNALLAALILSVAVNLLVAGLVLGRLGAGAGPGRGEAPPGAWAARQLSPVARSLVRERMEQALTTVRPLRRELREAQAGVGRAAGAEPFDVDVLKASLAELRVIEGRYRALLHERLAEVAAELPADERRRLVRAALLRERGRKGPPPSGPPR